MPVSDGLDKRQAQPATRFRQRIAGPEETVKDARARVRWYAGAAVVHCQ